MKFARIRIREDAREGLVTDLGKSLARMTLPEEFYVAIESSNSYGMFVWFVNRDCTNKVVEDPSTGESLPISAVLSEDIMEEAKVQDAVMRAEILPTGQMKHGYWLVDRERKLWRSEPAANQDLWC